MRSRLLNVLLLLLASAFLAAPRCAPPLPPALVATDPPAGGSVPHSAWLVLDFAGPVPPSSRDGAALACDGNPVPSPGHLLDADTLVVDPVGGLPPGGDCELAIQTSAGVERFGFQVAPAGPATELFYDRRDRDVPLPFPDDAFLVPDASRPTGFRPVVITPQPPGSAAALLDFLAQVAEQNADGWSPLGGIALQLSGPASEFALPLGDAASVDPLAPMALIDLTPGSPHFGQRVPFLLTPRTDTLPGQPTTHTLVLHASMPLEPMGTYGLVVTNRLLDTADEPLARSAFFDLVANPFVPGEAPEVTGARPLADQVIAAAEALAPVPVQREDVVLAVRITVRSTHHLPDDLLVMRQSVQATPPNVIVQSVVPDSDADVAAVVTGTFDVPQWRSGAFVNRDANGDPSPIGTLSLPFVLALPTAANQGLAPVLMYQHGNPGSAEAEVPSATRSWLGVQGFAVGGFTDVLNRTYSSTLDQSFAIFGVVLVAGEPPDFYIQTYAEQMAFVQALQSLDQLDVLPLGNPDGVPDLDPSVLVYEGISYGSVHGQAFLAYEPNIAAAGEVVGAARLAELIEYQDRTTPTGDPRFLVDTLPSLLTAVRLPDALMGLALFAINYDRQDPHNHARFLYRDPVMVDGTTQKASILVVEGLGDTFTTNNQTRSLAWQLGGIPQLAPALVPVPLLPLAAGPLQGNVDATTTAGFVQFAPAGIPGISPSPGCSFQFEGHFCAQSSPASRALRADFYQSALTGVPVIGP